MASPTAILYHYQPMDNSDPAHTATAPGGLSAKAPAMSPLMLNTSPRKLVAWDGTIVGKQVVVEHNLNYGCCLVFTSRTLGYPCSNVLARRVNELYPCRRHIFTSKTNPDAPFEPEVKRQAVMDHCTRRVSASEVARPYWCQPYDIV